jgi:hippurate hydrolase
MPEVIRSKTQSTPATINDEATADRVISVFEAKLPKGSLYSQPRQGMGAEDFSYFIEPETGVKGVYFWVGGTPAKKVDDAPSHHSPFFKVQPEPSITLGTEAMVLAALHLFETK